MTNRKIMVTGGAGFIGSHVVDLMLQKGFEVVVLDSFTTGTRQNLADAIEGYPESLQIEVADIRDDFQVKSVFNKHSTNGPFLCLVHLAAHVSVPASVNNPVFDAENNIIGTLNMIHAAKEFGVSSLVFSSSAAVYGTPNVVVVDEDQPTHPESPYGISKLAGELYLKIFKDNLKVVTFRFGNVYGERQSVGSTEGAFIPRIIDNIKKAAESELRGYGKPVRDFVYVKDIAQAVYLALSGPAGTYNLATTTGHSVQEVWSSVSSAMKERGYSITDPRLTPLLPGEIEKIILSTDKVKTKLGWQAQIPLQQGIRNTVEYYAPRK